MRLLNTQSLQMKEYWEKDVPRCAMLSHTWYPVELSLQSFHEAKDKMDEDQSMSKIKNFCTHARRNNFDWVWIDTICIDKSSSAELSEAINFVYRWYAQAKRCYAYLSDVDRNPDKTTKEEAAENRRQFQQSRWFTRGWTLQELLALSDVRFYDQAWVSFGTKKELATDISTVTRIAIDYLTEKRLVQKTDLTSLLGLFDLNMPLLYGEGDIKAFVRLQINLVEKSDDESNFAWTSEKKSEAGMLATSLDEFANSGNVIAGLSPSKERYPYRMTNKGLEFFIRHTHLQYSHHTITLDCRRKSASKRWVTIELRKMGNGLWRRVQCQTLDAGDSNKSP